MRLLAASLLLVLATSCRHSRSHNNAEATEAPAATGIDASTTSAVVAAQEGGQSALIGTWVGTVTTPHGSSDGFTVVIGREKGEWSLTMTMPSDQMRPGPGRDVKVTGSRITWTQHIMLLSCKGSAELIGNTLKGESDCGHASLGFVVTRK